MAPSPGPPRRHNAQPASLHLRWTMLGLLAFDLALWALIIGAVRRMFG